MKKLKILVDSDFFQNFILVAIICNAILIGLDTNLFFKKNYTVFSSVMDYVFLVIFTIEISIRILAHGKSFFKRGWNIFDLIIVIMSLLPESGLFSVFRIIRIIRVLRLISIIPKMRLISQALLKTLSPMLGVGILLLILFYIYAVITTNLYGEKFPKWFGTLGESFYSLFQIMTFESWSMGIVRPVMEIYPHSWIVFVSFLMIASYIVLNIAIGIIVDCISEIKNDKNTINQECLYLEKINKLENDIAELKILFIKNEEIK